MWRTSQRLFAPPLLQRGRAKGVSMFHIGGALVLACRCSAGGSRAFSQSSANGGENAIDDIFSAATAAPATTATYADWYRNARKLALTGRGPIYLGKGRPFPYNPAFVPVKPIPDALKDKVYLIWKSNPTDYTPRKLSRDFLISIERVKAIIKLKELQSRMVAAGFTVSRAYVHRMESALGATPPTISEGAKRALSFVDPIPPALVAIPKDSVMSPQEAASLLNRRIRPIFENVRDELEGMRPYCPVPPSEVAILEQRSIIRTDAADASRWKFVFSDMPYTLPYPTRSPGSRALPSIRTIRSLRFEARRVEEQRLAVMSDDYRRFKGDDVHIPPIDGPVYIREPNGDLRNADANERVIERKKIILKNITAAANSVKK